MEKYEEFTATEPSLEMFENKLKEYNDTERQIDAVEVCIAVFFFSFLLS